MSPKEVPSVHYTFISLQRLGLAAPPAGDGDGDGDDGRPPVGGAWSAQIFAQKLQFGEQCFVLHEVFGATSRCSDVELEGGNQECVICLSEPRDTAVLPCRHMCFCSYCAGIVRLQCDRCPVCRQKVVSLLQFRQGEQEQAPLPLAAAAGAAASFSPRSARRDGAREAADEEDSSGLAGFAGGADPLADDALVVLEGNDAGY